MQCHPYRRRHWIRPSSQRSSYQRRISPQIRRCQTAIGQQVGALKAEIGIGVGNLVPSKLPVPGKRQLDKIGAGTAAIISLVDPDLAEFQEELMNNIDGYGTSDSALIGQQVGALEAEIGIGVGNLVPSKLPAIPGAP
jgi:hypothetical protein